MPASNTWRGLTLRRKRLTVLLTGMFVVGAAVVIALPAGAGSNRQALRDVHGTKAFWHQTTLKRAIAQSPGMPMLKLRGVCPLPRRRVPERLGVVHVTEDVPVSAARGRR